MFKRDKPTVPVFWRVYLLCHLFGSVEIFNGRFDLLLGKDARVSFPPSFSTDTTNSIDVVWLRRNH
ncbi:hypothetical protein AUR64_14450 [Haloprofundus marisrubri]|uniref:Uncharacterized protein n=1 Tax=Haloprofundus marisrubri TaxID=1514971 RepID=A0A0W1R6I3_9EURY|nr:hypothetical protein AUR64_14450 [Haloprofundus marisrubri]